MCYSREKGRKVTCAPRGLMKMSTESKQETVGERLKKPVQFLKGVGARLAPLLNRLGLKTARDVLFFFPRTYEDLTQISPVESIDGSGQVCVCATVEEVELRDLSGGRSVLAALLRDETAPIRAVWFNQPFMREKLVRGQRVMLSGTPKRRGLCWEMSHPRVVPLGEDEQPPRGEMLPVYPATEGLTQSSCDTSCGTSWMSLPTRSKRFFPRPFSRA